MENKIIADVIGWISSFVYLIGNVILARHKVLGWWLRILGAIGWIVVGIVLKMSSILLLESIAIVTAIYAIYNWENRK